MQNFDVVQNNERVPMRGCYTCRKPYPKKGYYKTMNCEECEAKIEASKRPCLKCGEGVPRPGYICDTCKGSESWRFASYAQDYGVNYEF